MAAWLCEAGKLGAVFILGTWYLNLRVLRLQWARYAVSVLVTNNRASLQKGKNTIQEHFFLLLGKHTLGLIDDIKQVSIF